MTEPLKRKHTDAIVNQPMYVHDGIVDDHALDADAVCIATALCGFHLARIDVDRVQAQWACDDERSVPVVFTMRRDTIDLVIDIYVRGDGGYHTTHGALRLKRGEQILIDTGDVPWSETETYDGAYLCGLLGLPATVSIALYARLKAVMENDWFGRVCKVIEAKRESARAAGDDDRFRAAALAHRAIRVVANRIENKS